MPLSYGLSFRSSLFARRVRQHSCAVECLEPRLALSADYNWETFAVTTDSSESDWPKRRESVNATSANGMSVAVWVEEWSWGDRDIYGQIYEPDGSPRGERFIVTNSPKREYSPSTGIDDAGNVFVAWTRETSRGQLDVLASCFTSSGDLIAFNIPVATSSRRTEHQPSLSVARDGGFIVAFSQQTTKSNSDIYLRSFTADGDSLGVKKVATRKNNETTPSLAVSRHDGTLSVAYQFAYSRRDDDIRIKTFYPDGSAKDVAVTFSVAQDRAPRIAINNAGDIVAAWRRTSSDRMNEVVARLVRKDGVEQEEVMIAATNASAVPSVVIDPLSQAFAVAFTGSDGAAYLSEVDASGMLVSTQRKGLIGGSSPFVSIDESGIYFVTISRASSGERGDVVGSFIPLAAPAAFGDVEMFIGHPGAKFLGKAWNIEWSHGDEATRSVRLSAGEDATTTSSTPGRPTAILSLRDIVGPRHDILWKQSSGFVYWQGIRTLDDNPGTLTGDESSLSLESVRSLERDLQVDADGDGTIAPPIVNSPSSSENYVVDGMSFRVPAGFLDDGASVPVVESYAVVGLLGVLSASALKVHLDARYPEAWRLHDYLYSDAGVAAYPQFTREDVDRVMRAQLLESGMSSLLANLLYEAVRYGGASHTVRRDSDPPFAPSDVDVRNASSTSVELSWAPPAGGALPIAYRIRQFDVSLQSWREYSDVFREPNAILADMFGDNEYFFQVLAQSQEGDSAWSLASDVVRPADGPASSRAYFWEGSRTLIVDEGLETQTTLTVSLAADGSGTATATGYREGVGHFHSGLARYDAHEYDNVAVGTFRLSIGGYSYGTDVNPVFRIVDQPVRGHFGGGNFGH
jgi:hypothetical protein